MEAILAGVSDATAIHDVAVGLLAIFSRDYGMDSARATVEFAIRHADDLVGFDIAGTEIGHRPADYAGIVEPLRESGLGLTTHYGESGGPDYPKEAIEALGPARLGHGLSVAWDRDVTALVRDRGVTLEMCPTSNWLTGAVTEVRAHPALRLLRQGVRVTLNTDDPGLMGIDLVHELEVARDEIGFTQDDFRAVTGTALDASFLPEDRKAVVRERHFDWLARA
jgi:adenosine deaminase